MLELKIEAGEFYDSQSNKFIQTPECTLILEHSLISLAKWEAKWKIPYFGNSEKTTAQDLDYIRCMIVTPIKNDLVLKALTPQNIMQIRDYMGDPMTATKFSNLPNTTNKTNRKSQVMTAEVIYSHMFAHGIPIECQKWHLNRLLTQIKVCGLQNGSQGKMSKQQTSQWNAQQNAARRAKYNTRG